MIGKPMILRFGECPYCCAETLWKFISEGYEFHIKKINDRFANKGVFQCLCCNNKRWREFGARNNVYQFGRTARTGV